jgi:AraC-like DNA-binding protein
MNIARLVPAAPLDAIVALLWWSHRTEAYMATEHMLPSGSTQLVIALHEQPIAWSAAGNDKQWQRWTGAIVHGPQSRYYRAGPKPAGTVMGVAFRPGAAGAILGVPATELADRHVTLDALWGNGARELQERLALCPDANSALRLLELALRARLKRPLLMHSALTHALGANPAQVIEVLRAQSGYSHRHFIALFRSAVGLAPKQFSRIRRFSAAVRLLATQKTSLAALAADMGYADQAHFAREFRELCGVPPTAYRPLTPDSPYHHVAE